MSQLTSCTHTQLATRNDAFLQSLNEALQTPLKSKPYTAYITRSTPSVFLFLIDQSGSMKESVTLNDGRITTKAAFLADAINTTLNNLLDRCIKGNEIRDYFEIALIGYGKDSTQSNMAWEGSLSDKTWVKMSELVENYLAEHEETVERNIRGKTIQSIVKRKKWLNPLAQNKTPMHHAFTQAAELLEDWIVRYKGKDVYPPTIINITDGQYTDATNAQMLEAAHRLKGLKTMDGGVLLFNLHISSKGGQSVIFPHTAAELPDADSYAKILFDMSSDLPDLYNNDIALLRGTDTMSTFTGMAYNASLDSLVKLMNIGTSTTTRQIQQAV